MRFLLLTLFITAAVLINPSWGLTLEELIELGLERNPVISAAEYQEISAEEGIRSARASYLPQIEWTSIYSRTLEVPMLDVGFGQQMPLGYHDNYRNSLSFSLPLYTGSLRKVGYQSAETGYKLTQLSKSKTELEVKTNIALAYYGYKLAQANLSVSKNGKQRAEEHLASVKEQFASGYKSELDLLNAQLGLEQAKYSVLEAEKNLQMTRENLNLAIGLPLDSTYTVEGEMKYRPFEVEYHRLVDYALNHRIELKQLKYNHKLMELKSETHWRQRLPSLILNLDYTYNKPNNFENEFEDNLTATVLFNLPIFDGAQWYYDWRGSKAEIKGLDEQIKSATDGIKLEISNNFTQLRKLEGQIEVSKKALEIAQKAYNMAREQYDAGYISSLEYRDAEQRLTEAEFINNQAIYMYLTTVVKLKKSIGLGVTAEFSPEGEK